MRLEGADIEATRDVTCNVDGDILGDEVLQAYHQAMNELAQDNSGNDDVEKGVNYLDDEEGSIGEDGHANVNDNVDEDCDRVNGEDNFIGAEYYDDDDPIVSESHIDDSDEILETYANDAKYFEENSNIDQNPYEEIVIAD